MISPVFLGIDIGTSGIRGCCINEDDQQVAAWQLPFQNIAFQKTQAKNALEKPGKNQQDPNPWRLLLEQLIAEISRQILLLDKNLRITTIAIDGTSSTLIACKKDGTPVSPALMYNDQQSQQQAETIRRFAPAESAVHGASSSLAKALYLLEKYPETELFCHQADWLASHLTGHYGVSDENNCLKLGFDSIAQRWPEWLQSNNENAIIPRDKLPRVVAPGISTGLVKPTLIKKYSLAENCTVVAGTTDSNAAALATGANKIGDAVTSLGSTLVIKVFSDRPLFFPEYGIYSHRLNNHWLVGGASNSGGSVLLQHFSQSQLDAMTPQLKPEQQTGLNYYPLPGTGERFPVNDINKQNITIPRPENDILFFQALLEGIASIEAEGYKKLKALGAATPKKIFTAGGGSKNEAWTKIRAQITGLPVIGAKSTEACYGSALLARQNYLNR